MAHTEATTHEPYKPSPAHERVNPFDKNNKSFDPKPSSIYSTLASNTAPPATSSTDDSKSLDDLTKDRFKKQQGVRDQQTGRYSMPAEPMDTTPTVYAYKAPTTTTAAPLAYKAPTVAASPPVTSYSFTPAATTTATPPASTFSYKAPSTTATPAAYSAYKPPSIATTSYTAKTESVDAGKSDADLIFSRKPDTASTQSTQSSKAKDFKMAGSAMSDADIIFGGGKPAAEPVFGRYATSKAASSSSFSTSMSSDSDYIYGNKKSSSGSFNKSLSVSSDKDGDFSSDPTVVASRAGPAYQGIANDAFSDFDSPKNGKAKTTSWKQDDDDDYDLK